MSKHLMRAAGLAVVLALLLGIFPVLGSNQAQAASNVTVTRRTLLAGTAHATEAVIIRAPASGPTVLVVGGIHGDQPAGVQAAQRVAQYRDITRGTLIVVPAINKLAVQRGQRTAADGVDLNRTFPTRSGASPTDARSRALWNLIRSEGVEYVLDLHEGKNYQSISSSIGQMVIHYNNRGTKEMADAMVAALNRTVSGNRVWRTGGPPVVSGLTRAASQFLGLHAFHITTTTRDSMSLRVSQQLTAVDTVLGRLGMLPGSGSGGSSGGGSGSGSGSGSGGGSQQPAPNRPRVTTQTIAAGTKYATTLYIIDSGRPGPTVWISGGVHGSEVAGWMAADQIKNWSVGRGKLLVLPRANVPAVNNRTRSGPGDPDLNRQFPTSSGGSAKTTLSRAIWSALREHRPDWVIDLHEALSARNINPNSVGQTFIAYPRTAALNAGEAIFREMNRSISNRNYRFQVIRYPVQGSLARAATQFLGANGGIFETTRLVGVNTRINWQLQFVELLLDHLNMQPSRSRTASTGFGSAA
ncbi:MAG TPA: succinylglutamate desuccinylase/aspartoacylase family protein [Sphingobacteriaceae bacterium]|nr:succinylglutamate desuccinylase/aspartoacylase family protein [Sphingobacteriaceae bacterium]